MNEGLPDGIPMELFVHLTNYIIINIMMIIYISDSVCDLVSPNCLSRRPICIKNE